MTDYDFRTDSLTHVEVMEGFLPNYPILSKELEYEVWSQLYRCIRTVRIVCKTPGHTRTLPDYREGRRS